MTFENKNNSTNQLLKLLKPNNLELPQTSFQLHERSSTDSISFNPPISSRQIESLGFLEPNQKDEEKLVIKKHIESILFHPSNKRHSNRNIKIDDFLNADNKISSFALLNFDPTGVEVIKNKKNSKRNVSDKGHHNKNIPSGLESTLKGKMVSFISAKTINQTLEKKLERIKIRDHEFQLAKMEPQKRKNTQQLNQIPIAYNFVTSIPQGIFEEKDLDYVKENTSLIGCDNSKRTNLESTFTYLINDTARDFSSGRNPAKLNKDIYKLYKKIGVDKIADLLVKPLTFGPKSLFDIENKEAYTTVQHFVKQTKSKSLSNLTLPPITKKQEFSLKCAIEPKKNSCSRGTSIY